MFGWREKFKMANENETLQKLLDEGYHVEVVKPHSENFSEKYHVYKHFPFGKRYAILDESGNVTGIQG